MAKIERYDPFFDISRTDPFRGMTDLMRRFWRPDLFSETETLGDIRLDVSETDTGYKVTADIPGVKKEDISVSIDGQVAIGAEVKREKQEKSGTTLRAERYYGRQYRSVTLPQAVDEAKAEAKYADGVLELTLPKKPGAETKRIAIK
ncbi:MAG TPA: Hsp20/alpha crystallin family protein [Burkholderiales bacterium]|nr:Hsp20/alpha crystallin family protein [Burkholderiales bacterium]